MIASYVYSADNQAGLAQRYGSNLVIGRTIADIEEWPDRVGQGDGRRRQEGRRQVSRAADLGDRLSHSATRRGRRCRQDAQRAAAMSNPAQPGTATCGLARKLRSLRVRLRHGDRRRAGLAGQTRAPPTSSRSAAPAGFPPGWWRRRACPSSPSASPSTAAARRRPVGKEGTAGLLAAMLDQGAGDMPGPVYQKQIEKLAVRLAFDSDRDTFFGNFETLTKNLGKATELLRLAVTKPLLEPAILERTRAQLLARAGFEAGDNEQAGQCPVDGPVLRRAHLFAGHLGNARHPEGHHARRSRGLSQARHGQEDAARRGRRRHRCGDAWARCWTRCSAPCPPSRS